MISPCKDCTTRHPACHDRCEKYRTWKLLMSDINRQKSDSMQCHYFPHTDGEIKRYRFAQRQKQKSRTRGRKW